MCSTVTIATVNYVTFESVAALRMKILGSAIGLNALQFVACCITTVGTNLIMIQVKSIDMSAALVVHEYFVSGIWQSSTLSI